MLQAAQPTLTLSLPPGLAGTRETMKLMRLLARQGRYDDTIRQTACELTADLEPKDWYGEIDALFDYVQNGIRYQRDPVEAEYIATAPQILMRGCGDCDDKSVLLASLLESIGHETAFAALGFSPYELSHVIVLARLDDEWVSLDTTEPQPWGWRPPGECLQMLIFNHE